ncbi:MAG: SWIB/MDM2 domain-containing protein [Janthinobacterium lividum]
MSRTVAPAKPRTAGPGLMKPMTPSPELAAIIGAEAVPRTAVVAKVWGHIRANGLQDPADKRTIVADDKLRAVFGKDRCTMFEMQKLLSPHLKAA